jgi:hypothetical protein
MRARRTIGALAAVGSLLIVAQPGQSGATARCDHGVHYHPHNGHTDTWEFDSHKTVDGNHVHAMRNNHGDYDVANWC